MEDTGEVARRSEMPLSMEGKGNPLVIRRLKSHYLRCDGREGKSISYEPKPYDLEKTMIEVITE